LMSVSTDLWGRDGSNTVAKTGTGVLSDKGWLDGSGRLNREGTTTSDEEVISGFQQGLNADSSKPHYFSSEKRGLGFMMGVSFGDNSPDSEGQVDSPETSAWMLMNKEDKTNLLAVMPWDGNSPKGSENSYFRVYDAKSKDPTIYINRYSYRVIGHIHIHPSFQRYEGPSQVDLDGFSSWAIPKYIIIFYF